MFTLNHSPYYNFAQCPTLAHLDWHAGSPQRNTWSVSSDGTFMKFVNDDRLRLVELKAVERVRADKCQSMVSQSTIDHGR
jgi:hypothetical protein